MRRDKAVINHSEHTHTHIHTQTKPMLYLALTKFIPLLSFSSLDFRCLPVGYSSSVLLDDKIIVCDGDEYHLRQSWVGDMGSKNQNLLLAELALFEKRAVLFALVPLCFSSNGGMPLKASKLFAERSGFSPCTVKLNNSPFLCFTSHISSLSYTSFFSKYLL